jgi:thiol:disulfide interchange protein DsbD
MSQFKLILAITIGFLAGVARADSADVAASASGDTVVLTVTVHDGLHAQSHTPLDDSLIPLVAKPTAAGGVSWGEPAYPAPTIETLPALGKISVYVGKIEIRIPVKAAAGTALAGVVELQACNDDSCFPPEKLKWSTQAAAAAPTAAPATAPATAPSSLLVPPAAVTPGVGIASAAAAPTILGLDLTHDAYPLAFAAAFVVGILFNAMPCVLPVVPLKIMGFYEASQHHRGRSLALGAVFSAGLIASFGVLAVLVVAMHALDWGGLFQKTWFTVAIVAVLVAMAMNLLGLFTINLPGAMYQFAPRHDTYTGNFLFGILTAALSTPCTFGMFVTLLTWTTQQPPAIGVALVMMVGVGMAFPYFVLSGFPQVAARFPRTGPWGELVRQLLGFLVLTTAVYFAQPLFERFVSDRAFWWTAFAVVAVGAIFAVVRAFEFTAAPGARAAWMGVSLGVMVVAGLGAARFAARPFQWIPYSDQALSQARAAGGPVLVDFTATWCGNCHFIEGFVLNDPKVIAAVREHRVTMLKADVTDSGAPAHELLTKLSPTGAIPLTVVYRDTAGEPVRLDGIYSADDLRRAIGG